MATPTAENGVRISASILARIVIDDRYLLVLNKRRRVAGRRVYTPVGGAIMLDEAARPFLLGIGAAFETGANLRFMLPIDNVPAFEAWFHRREGRETSPYRELREELVEEEGVLDVLPEGSIRVTFLGFAKQRAITDRPGCEGLLTYRFYEVHDVGFLPEPTGCIRRAASDPVKRVALVTGDEIRGGRATDGTDIGSNCLPLLGPWIEPEC